MAAKVGTGKWAKDATEIVLIEVLTWKGKRSLPGDSKRRSMILRDHMPLMKLKWAKNREEVIPGLLTFYVDSVPICRQQRNKCSFLSRYLTSK